MSLHKIAVTVIAVVLVVVLYNLPRVVVDNDSAETGIGTADAQIEDHDFKISKKDSLKISVYLDQISLSGSNKKSTIFADSLANLYLAYNQLDSAEKYGRYILGQGDDVQNFKLAGEIFFKAYGFSQAQEEASKFSELAGNCFKVVLESTPESPDIKAKLAMTLVSTANPMEGIGLLREVLKDYPNNETAIYSLGVLSMQSGQYDKAVERFEKLVELNSENVQAFFYLAVSHFELGNKEKATELFELVRNMDDDPAIIQAADGYLKDINEL